MNQAIHINVATVDKYKHTVHMYYIPHGGPKEAFHSGNLEVVEKVEAVVVCY